MTVFLGYPDLEFIFLLVHSRCLDTIVASQCQHVIVILGLKTNGWKTGWWISQKDNLMDQPRSQPNGLVGKPSLKLEQNEQTMNPSKFNHTKGTPHEP